MNGYPNWAPLESTSSWPQHQEISNFSIYSPLNHSVLPLPSYHSFNETSYQPFQPTFLSHTPIHSISPSWNTTTFATSSNNQQLPPIKAEPDLTTADGFLGLVGVGLAADRGQVTQESRQEEDEEQESGSEDEEDEVPNGISPMNIVNTPYNSQPFFPNHRPQTVQQQPHQHHDEDGEHSYDDEEWQYRSGRPSLNGTDTPATSTFSDRSRSPAVGNNIIPHLKLHSSRTPFDPSPRPPSPHTAAHYIPALTQPRMFHLNQAYFEQERDIDRIMLENDPDFDPSRSANNYVGYGDGVGRRSSGNSPEVVGGRKRRRSRRASEEGEEDEEDGEFGWMPPKGNGKKKIGAKKGSSSKDGQLWTPSNGSGEVALRRTEIPAVADDPSVKPVSLIISSHITSTDPPSTVRMQL